MSVRGLVIKKIRNLLTADSVVQQYVGDRVYAAHISTIQDAEYPAISIAFLQTTGRDTNGPFMDNLMLQIEPWFDSIGNNQNHTWDNVAELHERILEVLHRCVGTDNALGIKILEITNVNEAQQITDPDGVMHYPSLWKVRATTA